MCSLRESLGSPRPSLLLTFVMLRITQRLLFAAGLTTVNSATDYVIKLNPFIASCSELLLFEGFSAIPV